MSLRLLVCFFFCFGESTVLKGNGVNQILPGSDVSLRCSSEEAHWTGPRLDKTVRVKINRTEYLLIKNFQKENSGDYHCKGDFIQLEPKEASTNDNSVLFRASDGASVFLFCKGLLSSSSKTTWFWRSHHSHTNLTLGTDSTHFGNRLQIRDKNNDFSVTISPVDWKDSGKYECLHFISSSKYNTVFEVVVVRVSPDPQHLNEGDNVTLKCTVSIQDPRIRLYWINMKTEQNFPNPHLLSNVTIDKITWSCAVFNDSGLKALIPLTLNISQPSDIRKQISLICAGFLFILVVLIGALCWRKRIEETPDVASPACELSRKSNYNPDEETEVLYSSVELL